MQRSLPLSIAHRYVDVVLDQKFDTFNIVEGSTPVQCTTLYREKGKSLFTWGGERDIIIRKTFPFPSNSFKTARDLAMWEREKIARDSKLLHFDYQ